MNRDRTPAPTPVGKLPARYGETAHLNASGRWLDALGRPDAAAWGCLEDAQHELAFDDPVRRAIDHLLLDEPAGRRPAANAALAFAAERARDEPFAFDRLVLEWARRRTLRRRDLSFAAIDACVTLFEERLFDPRRVVAPAMARALVGLALAYRADDRRASGHHTEAARELTRALRHLDPPPDEPGASLDSTHREIRAAILELRVDLANAERDHATAEARLAEAAALLDDTPIPGRRAETLWRIGRLDLALDRDDHAALAFERAAIELPEDVDLHLRLDILHLRAFAEAALGSVERAAFYLAEAAPLVATWGHERLEAQRHHLLGHLAARERRDAEAEEHWRRSYRLALRHGHHLDAIQTLAALLRLMRRSDGDPGLQDAEIRQLLDELL